MDPDRIVLRLVLVVDNPQVKRTAIRKVSTKRAAQRRVYLRKRAVFLQRRLYCEIFKDGCTRRSTQIHHMHGCEGAKLLDEEWWLPACASCHRYLHDHPRMARDEGFLI